MLNTDRNNLWKHTSGFLTTYFSNKHLTRTMNRASLVPDVFVLYCQLLLVTGVTMSIGIAKTTNTSETSLEQSRVIVGIIPGKA